MVALNFTVVVEMALFLVFLWVTNRFIFQPLLRVMDARDAKLNGDRTSATADAAEAHRLDAEYAERLAQAGQAAAQHLRQARYDAYQHNRDEMDQLRRQSDGEIAAFRENLQATLTEERRQYPALIAGLVETMDQWARGGGTVR